MGIENLAVTARIEIVKGSGIHFQSLNLDFDLFVLQLKRLLDQHGANTTVKVNCLEIDSAKVRSSLFIKSLSELYVFMSNLAYYAQKVKPEVEVMQALCEYVGCYDVLYHNISPQEVLDNISKVILHCCALKDTPSGFSRKHKSVQVAKNWYIYLKEFHIESVD